MKLFFKWMLLLSVNLVLANDLSEPYTLLEFPSAIERLNASAPETEQITDKFTYREFRHKDPRLPFWSFIEKVYREQHNGNTKGLTAFVFSKKNTPYTLEEIPLVLARINANSPESEQMYGRVTYMAFRRKDPRLPSWMTLVNWYKKEYGDSNGLSAFVFSETKRKGKFYELKEVPLAVASINANSPAREQMNSIPTYRAFRNKDPKLPSWMTLVNWYKKEYGDSNGLSAFVFPRKEKNTGFYNLEEVPLALMRVIARSSTQEKMIFRAIYEVLRSQDSTLPTWDTLIKRYEKKYGEEQDLSVAVSNGDGECEISMGQP